MIFVIIDVLKQDFHEEELTTMTQDAQKATRSPLFRWRTDQHLTQRDAAKRLGIGQSQYSGYERGESLPRREHLAMIGDKSGEARLPAALVMYHFGITQEEAAWFFRQTEKT